MLQAKINLKSTASIYNNLQVLIKNVLSQIQSISSSSSFVYILQNYFCEANCKIPKD